MAWLIPWAVLAAWLCGLAVAQGPWTLAEDITVTTQDGRTLFSIPNSENDASLQGVFGASFPEGSNSPQACDDITNCLQFPPDIRLTATKVGQCYEVSWTTPSNLTLEDCFDYGEDSWYGGPEKSALYYPFNKIYYNESSYITKDPQSIAEPYWVTSAGYVVYVNKTTPLFIDSNNERNNSLCLIAKQDAPYLPRGETRLSYTVCAHRNARRAHMNAVGTFLGKPADVPDRRMVQHPIWSTWARFKRNVNESAVRDFAQEIVANGFNNSQIEIDDNWETCYGSTEFNKTRFPDMARLGTQLHYMGFRVTLWAHPFVNEDCHVFESVRGKGYLVSDQSGDVLSKWWNGRGAVLDFTKDEVQVWFMNKHRQLLAENNIDSLKMDAGEAAWLPQVPKLIGDVNDQPKLFTAAYTRTVSQFGPLVEVRTGHGTQDLPIYVRMMDKDSKWTFENGLPTLLTTLFQFNLNGYPFVLPDMVGGNAYGDVVSKELFIRWLQANTFMPVIQFSVAPWDFDNQTVEIIRKFTSLHYQYSDRIIEQMEKSVRTGEPVNTPLWWVAPEDREAQTIWSEYMLGDDILVAPVVEQGAVSRDIYLPAGTWRDQENGKDYSGPQWLRSFPAPLDVLPYFTRIGSFDDLDVSPNVAMC